MNYCHILYAPLPPPCHKVCDVAYSCRMKRQTLPSQAEGAVQCWVRCTWRSENSPVAEETSGMERLLRKCQIRNQLVRECMAECLGVYILMVSVALLVSKLIRKQLIFSLPVCPNLHLTIKLSVKYLT